MEGHHPICYVVQGTTLELPSVIDAQENSNSWPFPIEMGIASI